MIVVSDTSAIINLAAVGQLHLLEQLYGTVIIPQAVRVEIVAGGPTAPGPPPSRWPGSKRTP